MINKDKFADLLAPQLKLAGFRKKGRTWRRGNSDVLEVFQIQGSSWDKDDFYINLGIFLKALGSDLNPSANHCHVQHRVPREIDHDEQSTFNYALSWFSDRNSRSKLKECVEADSHQGLVFSTIKNELLS